MSASSHLSRKMLHIKYRVHRRFGMSVEDSANERISESLSVEELAERANELYAKGRFREATELRTRALEKLRARDEQVAS
jgi:hypothetical protein